MRRFFLLFAVLLPLAASAAPVPPELIAFYKKWPKSTRELGRWARGSPKTAPLWMGWAGKTEENLVRAREFVAWLHANRGANPFDFAEKHKDWLVFERLQKYSEEGLNGFVDWCRKHKYSCTELFALDTPAVRVARAFALKKANQEQGIPDKPAAAPNSAESAPPPAPPEGESAEGEKP